MFEIGGWFDAGKGEITKIIKCWCCAHQLVGIHTRDSNLVRGNHTNFNKVIVVTKLGNQIQQLYLVTHGSLHHCGDFSSDTSHE